ncbi:MAG: hypothetical protein MJ252_10495 [archaeon]|nr:hypothetical protein [archaeon]
MIVYSEPLDLKEYGIDLEEPQTHNPINLGLNFFLRQISPELQAEIQNKKALRKKEKEENSKDPKETETDIKHNIIHILEDSVKYF